MCQNWILRSAELLWHIYDGNSFFPSPFTSDLKHKLICSVIQHWIFQFMAIYIHDAVVRADSPAVTDVTIWLKAL